MLPHFKYHPDPGATGSVEVSTATCRCCDQARGYVYTGPVYAREELEVAICPWCFEDGSAAERFGAELIQPGGIGVSTALCQCCGQARGYVCTGLVVAREDLESAICPWCIADGSAAERFGAEFTEPGGVASGLWVPVPDEVVDEVCHRTPGFTSWQNSRWWTHCRDAGEFLGRAGHDDLVGRWAGALDEIRGDAEVDDEDWETVFEQLDVDGDATAYVFRCRHCGRLGGYADWS